MTQPVQDITAVVLTLNEERHLPDCVQSLGWVDQLLVLDSGSTDGTISVAGRYGARIEQHTFENYSRQRQHALGLVNTEWVFFVDADERVTDELAAEARAIVSDTLLSGLRMPRRNEFWGHTMLGGGWWPDYQLRLLRTAHASFDPNRAVHELADVNGTIGDLTAPLVHINYDSIREFREKQRAYSMLEAERRMSDGWPLRRRQFALQPLREFWRRYVSLSGWRDGPTGLIVCGLLGWYEAVTLARLRRLRQDEARS